ncbi:hypothetical protein M9Y10_039769 [Tritrichomonas musculus]|uniref:Leucine-rich repeat domain-containing protein n=1 Tax=Tritrichomonas musculus TaxID=1915356 RepID=A0ABR2GR85_9EUKA
MNAFEKCAALTEIDAPPSVAEIEASAFISCTALRRTSLPPPLTRISDYAFCGWNQSSFRLSRGARRSPAVRVADRKLCLQKLQVALPRDAARCDGSCQQLPTQGLPAAHKSGNTAASDASGTAFPCCTPLCEVEIPPAVSKIASSAFEECASLPTSSAMSASAPFADCAINKSESEVHDRVYS